MVCVVSLTSLNFWWNHIGWNQNWKIVHYFLTYIIVDFTLHGYVAKLVIVIYNSIEVITKINV
jgi:hypothetical protein